METPITQQKIVAPLSVEDAKKVAAQKEQQELEKEIFAYTETFNNRIIEASKAEQKYIYLFRFYVYPKFHTPDIILKYIFEAPYVGFKYIDPWFCDNFGSNRKAYIKAVKSFEDIGYKVRLQPAGEYKVPLVRTKKLFKKPKWYLGFTDYWIRNALNDNLDTSDDVTGYLDNNNEIKLQCFNVILSWE